MKAASDTLTDLSIGDNLMLSATPINANTLTFACSSSNNNVATVDQTGKVTVTGTGYAEITVETEDVNSDNNGTPAEKLKLTAKVGIKVD
ncbi:MAG: Ig-like domain-containing protein [Tannerella sp.]|nr:Ig-like domain-containing protein [Tannerella sp.]